MRSNDDAALQHGLKRTRGQGGTGTTRAGRVTKVPIALNSGAVHGPIERYLVEEQI